jgi:protein-disulfide isomerase
MICIQGFQRGPEPMISKMIRLAGATCIASLMLIAAAPAAEPSFSEPQKTEIEKIIRDYLVGHPEVLQEAMAELEKRQAAEENEMAKAAVAANAETLFNSSRQVVLGNTKGDVTLVEFFDYNCHFCKGALPALMDLMKDDAKLRVVLKEFPVLGPGSVEAAKVAVAVRMQDKTGKKYLEFHQKLLGGRGQADKAHALAVAKEVGMDMTRLEKDLGSDEVKVSLEESLKLAETLGLNGTPSYVVGDDVVVGAVGLDALRGKISAARCGKASC